MKARKVYEFVNPRKRNFDIEVGPIKELKELFLDWIHENHLEDHPIYHMQKYSFEKIGDEYWVIFDQDVLLMHRYIKNIPFNIKSTGIFSLKYSRIDSGELDHNIEGLKIILQSTNVETISGGLFSYKNPQISTERNIVSGILDAAKNREIKNITGKVHIDVAAIFKDSTLYSFPKDAYVGGILYVGGTPFGHGITDEKMEQYKWVKDWNFIGIY